MRYSPHFFSARFVYCLIFLRFLRWIGFIACMGRCWFWAGPMWRRRRPTKWAVRPLSAPAASKLNRAQHARLLLPVHTYMYTYTNTRTIIHKHKHKKRHTTPPNWGGIEHSTSDADRHKHIHTRTTTYKHRYTTPFHTWLSLDCIGLNIFDLTTPWTQHCGYHAHESEHLSSTGLCMRDFVFVLELAIRIFSHARKLNTAKFEKSNYVHIPCFTHFWGEFGQFELYISP